METNNENNQPQGGANEPQERSDQQQPQQPEQQQDMQQNQPQQQPQQQSQQNTDNTGSTSNDVEENRAITYLSYLGLLFLVPMLVKKDSPFAQFHSKQGLVLTIGWFIGGFLYALFGLGILVHIAILVLSIMGLVNVSKGETKDLPIVGDIAKKFNI